MPSIKAVIDTNVIVSGLLGSAASRAVIEMWLDGHYGLVLSSQLIDELLDVLARPKLSRYIKIDEQTVLVNTLLSHAEFVLPSQQVTLCRDPKDDIFLNVAIAGHVEYLVSRDNDLLDDEKLKNTMSEQFGVHVVQPFEFLQLLK